MSSQVARHYARVLLDTVAADGGADDDLERLASGLEEFAASLESSPELLKTLASPAVARSQRARLAETVADRILPDSRLGKFVSVMVRRERSEHLGETAAAFRAALDERRGIVEAEVVSARQLDERDRASLREAIGAAFSGTRGSGSARIRSCWAVSSSASGIASTTPASSASFPDSRRNTEPDSS